MTEPIQPDQRAREAFERQGYLTIGQILSSDEVADLRERVDRIFYEASGVPKDSVRDLSEVADRPRTYSVLQVVDLHSLDHAFDDLARRRELLDWAECLLGPEVLLFRDQAFYKPANHGGELYMHQDNRYWHLEPPKAITVWIALDDATIENGCVHFVPGSHLLGRVEHIRASGGKSILLEARWDKSDSVPIQVPAGYATIHHCQTLHWSPPNHTDRPRRAHTVEYVAADVTSRGEPLVARPVLSRSHEISRAEDLRNFEAQR